MTDKSTKPEPLSPEEERDLREHAAKYPGQFGYELRYFATLDATRAQLAKVAEAAEVERAANAEHASQIAAQLTAATERAQLAESTLEGAREALETAWKGRDELVDELNAAKERAERAEAERDALDSTNDALLTDYRAMEGKLAEANDERDAAQRSEARMREAMVNRRGFESVYCPTAPPTPPPKTEPDRRQYCVHGVRPSGCRRCESKCRTSGFCRCSDLEAVSADTAPPPEELTNKRGSDDG